MDIAQLSVAIRADSASVANQRMDAFVDKAGRAERAAGGLEKGTTRLDGSMRRAAQAGAMLGGALGVAFSVGGISAAMDRYTSMANMLSVISDGQRDVNEEIRSLADIASRTRAPLESIVSLYQRVGISATELGASNKQVKQFVEGVSLALAQQGGSASEASGALMQLSQALAGGVVRAEEFNSMLEGAYPIVLAAARGIEGAGGSVGKLRKMMLDGEVASKMFFDAILSQTDALAEAFAKTTPTIGQAMGQVRDSFTLVVGEFDRLTGASSAVAEGILWLAGNLETAVIWVGSFSAAIVATTAATWALNGGLVAAVAGLVSLRAVLMTLGIGVVTLAIGLVVQYLYDAVKAAGGFGAALQQLVGVATEVWERIKIGVNLLGEEIGAAGMAIEATFAGVWAAILSGMDTMLASATAKINAFLNSAGSIVSTMTLGAVGGDWGNFAAPSVGGDAARAQADQLTALAQEYRQSLNASWGALFRPLGKGVDSSITGGVALGSLQGLPAELQDSAAAAQSLGTALDGAKGSAAKAAAEGPKLKEQLTEAQKAAEDFEGTLGSAFKNLVTGASSFKEALSQVIDKLADMFAQQAFQGLFSGSGGGGFLANIFGAIGFGGARANGGPVEAGQAYVVGERRPELFVPSQSGSILPFVPRAQSGGEVVVRTYFDPQTEALTQRIERVSGDQVRAAAPQIVGQSVNAVGQQNRRTRRYLGK